MRLVHKLRIKLPSCGTYTPIPTSPTLPCRPYLPTSKAYGTLETPSRTSQLPPDTPINKVILEAWRRYEFQGADALTQWLNARWKKSGYAVCGSDVEGVLMGSGDLGEGTGDVHTVEDRGIDVAGVGKGMWDEVFIRRLRGLA